MLEQQGRDLVARVSGLINRYVDDVGGRDALVEEFDRQRASELEILEAALREERTARETAERMQERFRMALYVYLQERDGPAGPRAPTPETLALIRTLVGEAE